VIGQRGASKAKRHRLALDVEIDADCGPPIPPGFAGAWSSELRKAAGFVRYEPQKTRRWQAALTSEM
jgi:hypothetical protein